jgi:hypothetical protein
VHTCNRYCVCYGGAFAPSEATGRSLVRFFAFNELLDVSDSWVVSFYKMWDSVMPIGVFAPEEVLVSKFKHARDAVLIAPPKGRGRGRRLADSAVEDVDLADDGDDAADDDGSDEEGEPSDDDAIVVADLAPLHFLAAEFELAIEEEMLHPESDAPAPEPPEDGAPAEPSASSGAAPVPAPSDPPHVVGHALVEHHAAEVTVEFGEYGTITWYRNTKTCVAHCIKHGKRLCRFTKITEPKRATNPAAGRPIGLMCAWLLAHDCEVDMHRMLKLLPFAWEERNNGRARLSEIGVGNVQLLLDKERRPREGEGEEPEGDP